MPLYKYLINNDLQGKIKTRLSHEWKEIMDLGRQEKQSNRH